MAFNNKLFKLKKYFSIEETAERLTSTLGEEVSVVDVLGLAIDHHLIISVIIEDEMYGVYSKLKKTTKGELLNVNDDGSYQDMFKNIRYMPLSEINQEIELVEHLSPIIHVPYGCYDLPMKWAEQLDVLWLYEQKKGKCPKEWTNLDGAFLCFGDDYINIMSMFDPEKIDVDYTKGINAFIDKETREPITKDNYDSYFYPAGGLVYSDGSQDIEFIFRREHIEEFEQSLLNNSQEKKQDTDPTNLQIEFIRNLLFLKYGDKAIDNPRNFIENKKSELVIEFQLNGLKYPSGKILESWLKK